MARSHASRGHATWSASASERRWGCPGSLALEAEAGPGKESHAAAWGTACHEVAEKCLRGGGDAIAHLGLVVKTKQHEIEVDEEVCETAQVFVDYVRSRVGEQDWLGKECENCGGAGLDRDSNACKRCAGTGEAFGYRNQLLVEQNFSLADLHPPFDAGGTGDAVIMSPDGTIEIVDLKGGRGIVVEAVGNKQLRTYALGAYMANPGPWKKVIVTIVQPRAPHPDGRIRSEEFHVSDLIEWTSDLLEAMESAQTASAAREVIGEDLNGAPETPGAWADAYLSAGEHCTFCAAAATCPALAQRSLEVAQTFFEPETGRATTPPPPESLEIPQIVRVLDHADMIQNWLNAVRAYAQDRAEMGVPITDGTSTYVLTPKRAMRKWKGEVDALELGLATGRDTAEFYQEPKMMSPAQVEKLLGKKGYEAVKDLVVQESSGFNLTRSDKTTRGAATPPALEFFKPEGKG